MELYFKQRLLSFFDSFDIYDEDDNVVYTVEGQPAWLHKLHVLNAAGEHIATVRQELSLLASFELLVGERRHAFRRVSRGQVSGGDRADHGGDR